MKILVASDSFKGSLSSLEVINAVQTAASRVDSSIEIVGLPIADGGEGTLASLLAGVGGKRVKCVATDPLGRKMDACFGVAQSAAMVELAVSTGLTLLSSSEQNPCATTSYGLGEVMGHALLAPGIAKIIMGIGGSATNDGGVGMAQALGLRVYRSDGSEICTPVRGADLSEIARVDASHMNPRLKDVDIQVLCDVNNPFAGETGAAYVYAKQKGASSEEIALLDAGLHHLAGVIRRDIGCDVQDLAGAGAAGGIGGGLAAFCGAKLVPGIETILDFLQIEEKLQAADVVITGEGRVDAQTAFGKVVWGVAKRAKLHHKPVICLAGSLGPDLSALYANGVDACFSICCGPISEPDAMTRAFDLLVDAAENAIRLFLAGASITV